MSDLNDLDEKTRELMGALMRQPPKLHDEMKLGKAKQEKSAGAVNKAARPSSKGRIHKGKTRS